MQDRLIACFTNNSKHRLEVILQIADVLHLAKDISCLEDYHKSMFSIVRKARAEYVLHVLEALFIRGLKPELHKQMEFVKSLHLVECSYLTHIHMVYGVNTRRNR